MVAAFQKYEDGILYASCDAKWPNIYFMIDNYWLQLEPSDYVIDDSLALDGSSLCRLKLRSVNLPFNILGMPIFMGYYVTHSWEPGASYMSFAPHIDSEKRKPVKD